MELYFYIHAEFCDVFYFQVPQPHISPIVNLNDPENLFGLTERVVAVESLVFLAEQLESLRPYLEHLVRHEPRKHFIQQFYLQVGRLKALYDREVKLNGCNL